MTGAPPRCDIFLSHNRRDRERVRDIAEGLELEFGIPHFLDDYAIPAGEAFMPWIERALAGSRGCAVFLGERGWGKTHLWEAELALARYRSDPSFRFIPVVLGQASDADMARLGAGSVFSSINWVQFPEAGVDRAAIAKLRAALTGEPEDGTRGPARLTPYILRRNATRWRETRDHSILLRGTELAEAERLVAQAPDVAGTAEVVAYLSAATAAARARSRRLAMVALLAGGILATVSAVALQQSQVARSRELAALAAAADHGDRGLLLAEAAYSVRPTVEARAALLAMLRQHRHVRTFLHGHGPGVRALAVDGGRRLVAASGEGGRVVLWTVERPSDAPRTLAPPSPGPQNRVHALAFTPEGRLVVAYERGGVAVWSPHAGDVRPIAGWPAATPGTRQVSTDWEGADPEPPERRGERPTLALSVSADGRRAFAGDFGGRTFEIDLASERVLRTVQLDVTDVRSVAMVGGGTTVMVADGGGRIFMMDPRTGQARPARTQPHSSRLVLLEPAEASGAVTLDSSGHLARWSARAGALDVVSTASLPLMPVSAALHGGDARILAGTRSGEIRAFSLDGTEIEDGELVGHRLATLAAACGANVCVSGGLGGEVIAWNVGTAHPLLQPPTPSTDLVVALRRTPSGSVQYISQREGGFRWTDALASGSGERPAPGFSTFAAQDGGDALLLAASDGRVGWLSRLDQEAPVELRGPGGPGLPPGVYLATVSDSGRFAAGVAHGSTIRAWRTAEPDRPLLDQVVSGTVSALRFSPDDRFLLAGDSQGRITEWRLNAAKAAPLVHQVARGWIFALAFDAAGDRVFVGTGAGDRRVRAWSLKQQRLLLELPERHHGSVSELALSPDGTILASAADDDEVVLWDTRSWRELGALPHGPDVVFQDMAFDGTGTRLVTALDHGVFVWQLGDETLIRAACRLANRRISTAEWAEAVGGRQPDTRCESGPSASR